MHDAISFLQEQVSPELARLAGVLVVVYLGILGVVRLLEIWRSFRTRRAILEEEKLFNEILKLRYEIEALRKQHDLPDLLVKPTQVVVGEGTLTESAESEDAPLLRFHLRMPDLPTFSLAPTLSLMRLRLQRPPIGAKRALWALKWVAAVFVFFSLFMAAFIDALSSEVKGGVIVLTLLLESYLLLTCAYHSVLSLVALSAEAWRNRAHKSGT
jgi:hypothetical protein